MTMYNVIRHVASGKFGGLDTCDWSIGGSSRPPLVAVALSNRRAHPPRNRMETEAEDL